MRVWFGFAVAAGLLVAPLWAGADKPLSACRFQARPTAAAVTSSDGFVLCFNPPASQYDVRHASGVVTPPQELMLLQRGDTVTVNHAASRAALIVFTVGGVEMKLPDDTNATSYMVPQVGHPSPARLALLALVQFVADLIPRPNQGTGSEGAAVQAAVQGSSGPSETTIAIPLIDKPLALMVTGRRDLRMAWFGGAPPFRIRLFSGSATAVAELDSVPDRIATLRDLDLAPGVYYFEVRCAHATHGSSFRVDPPEALPHMSGADLNALAQTTESDELKETLRAGWLSQQENGAWALQAYEDLASVPDDYPPAAALRSTLEHGL